MEYKEVFYNSKKYKDLSKSKLQKTNKNLKKLKISCWYWLCWFWRSWWWTDDGFTGRRNNYIAYKSNGDRYGNLSPKKYLDIITPYLRDWINNYKPTTGSNNE